MLEYHIFCGIFSIICLLESSVQANLLKEIIVRILTCFRMMRSLLLSVDQVHGYVSNLSCEVYLSHAMLEFAGSLSC